MNTNKRDSCHELFKQLYVFPLQSQYTLSILIFISKNRDLLISNSEIHGINTRFNSDLPLLSITLTLFQKGIFFSGSRFMNHLPPNFTNLFNNKKLFKSALKKYLLENILIQMLMILVFNIICYLINYIITNFL